MDGNDLEPEGQTVLELTYIYHIHPLVFFSYFIQHPPECFDTLTIDNVSHFCWYQPPGDWVRKQTEAKEKIDKCLWKPVWYRESLIAVSGDQFLKFFCSSAQLPECRERKSGLCQGQAWYWRSISGARSLEIAGDGPWDSCWVVREVGSLRLINWMNGKG